MSENKLKHLEFIQGVMNRMAGNSFLIKGWSVTLVAALFALSAKDANPSYILIAYIPVVMFWVLDGYFLFQECLYRTLYNHVRKLNHKKIDFSMNAAVFKKNCRSWFNGMFSRTLFWFYGTLIAVMLITMYLITK